MDRSIVISTLLLVGLTWLLYKLTEWLAADGKKAEGQSRSNAVAEDAGISFDDRSQKPIHQRLRK
jgi:hypothetical protein